MALPPRVAQLEREVAELRERVYLLEQALRGSSRTGPTEFRERREVEVPEVSPVLGLRIPDDTAIGTDDDTTLRYRDEGRPGLAGPLLDPDPYGD